MALSPSGSSKRARTTINNANQTVTCVVDGCTVDLTNCRKYHQRHKVCEVHSKTPQVSINGKKLRFCQQCSRFHSLEEFDEGKRSCRKRLDGHNRRRRKAQPNIYYGVNVLQFVGPQVHQTTAPTNPPLAQVGSAPSLLSSSPSQTSGTTVSHVVHPSASSLDPGLSYGGLENGSGMIDMGSHHYRSCDHEDPQTLPFYWQ